MFNRYDHYNEVKIDPNQKTIKLAFQHAKLPDEHNTFLNNAYIKLTDLVEGCYIHEEPFRHVEIVSDDNFAYSIKYNDRVSKKYQRQFSSKTYDGFLSVKVNEQVHKTCFDFLDEKYDSMDTFDPWFENRFIPVYKHLIPKQKPNQWFCSQLISHALQYSDIMDPIMDPIYITPQVLYDELTIPNKYPHITAETRVEMLAKHE